MEWGDPQEPTEISISHRIDETQQAWTQPQSSDVSEDLPYSALTHTSLGGRGTCYRMTRRQAVKLYESKAVEPTDDTADAADDGRRIDGSTKSHGHDATG